MDDVICGTSNPRDSLQCFEEFRNVLSKGRFNLRKLVGNELWRDVVRDIVSDLES